MEAAVKERDVVIKELSEKLKNQRQYKMSP